MPFRWRLFGPHRGSLQLSEAGKLVRHKGCMDSVNLRPESLGLQRETVLRHLNVAALKNAVWTLSGGASPEKGRVTKRKHAAICTQKPVPLGRGGRSDGHDRSVGSYPEARQRSIEWLPGFDKGRCDQC